MRISFSVDAIADFIDWQSDQKIAKRLNRIIKEIMRTPFEGIGKPEPLKYDLQGCWSRRIDDEHRILYRLVGEDEIHIIQCKKHY